MMADDKEDSFDESFNLDDENVPDDDENSDLDSEDEIELMNLTTDKNDLKKSAGDLDSDNDF